jgi:tRNA A37 threonylcarbamoyladenosine modification protein TsaB
MLVHRMTRFAAAIEVSNPALGSEVALAPMHEGAGEGMLDEAAIATEVVGPHDDDAVQALARLCTRAGAFPRQLQRVAVSIGPGGFTAVRTALTSARMLAEATGASLVGVPSAIVAAAGVLQQTNESNTNASVLVLLASKGDSAWCSAVVRRMHPNAGHGALAQLEGACEPGVRSATELSTMLLALRDAGAPAAVALADGFCPPAMRAVLDGAGVPVQVPALRAAACLRLSVHAAPSEPASLQPIYPREPEAVTKWRQLRAKA